MKCLFCKKPIEEAQKRHGLHKECFRMCFRIPLQDDQDFDNVVIRQTSAHSDQSSWHSKAVHQSFFKGKFKKYTASLAKKSYILKVQEDKYPELPYIEYICNGIARLCKLRVPDFFLIDFENVRPTFVVSNILNDYPKSNLVHFYHYMDQKSQWSCQDILKVIKQEVRIGCVKAQEDFVRLCLFDALIANHDRHGRNLAFIETHRGKQLSPFYDNPSYFGIEEEALLGAKHNPCGHIFTSSSKEPIMKDYVLEFQSLGFDHVVKQFRQQIPVEDIKEMIGKVPLTQKRKDAFERMIDQRYEELICEIS